LKLTPTKILPWLEECIMPFRNAPGNVAIDVEAPETEWSFYEQQLSRAFHNLLANAVQHAPPNGWVKVTAKKENGQLILSVGPGVAEEGEEPLCGKSAGRRDVQVKPTVRASLQLHKKVKISLLFLHESESYFGV
jgi:K+-sensing histidine kinase KdpD